MVDSKAIKWILGDMQLHRNAGNAVFVGSLPSTHLMRHWLMRITAMVYPRASAGRVLHKWEEVFDSMCT
jgi:hypothetical protein